MDWKRDQLGKLEDDQVLGAIIKETQQKLQRVKTGLLETGREAALQHTSTLSVSRELRTLRQGHVDIQGELHREEMMS